MFKLYNWKEPLFKKDLIAVIINGLIFGILGGILAGVLDYLMLMINFSISFGLIILTYMIGIKVRKSFYSYHILYPVLGLAFLVLGLFISYATFYFVAFKFDAFIFFIDPFFYLNFLLKPANGIINFFTNGYNPLSLSLGILNVIIYIWAFVFCYRLIKGRT